METGKYLNHFTHQKYTNFVWGITVNQQNSQIIVANCGAHTNIITIHAGYENINNNQQPFGKLIKVIGDNGGIKFDSPRDITINSKGHLIVSSNHKINIFDRDCTLVKSFGSYGDKNGEFNYPHGICVDPSDNIFVVDCFNHRIQIFSSDGKWIHTFGKGGKGDGCFYYPRGITIDNENGYVYVVDCWNHRVVMF